MGNQKKQFRRWVKLNRKRYTEFQLAHDRRTDALSHDQKSLNGRTRLTEGLWLVPLATSWSERAEQRVGEGRIEEMTEEEEGENAEEESGAPIRWRKLLRSS